MENTIETLPLDHESNRLGTLVINFGDQLIYEHTRNNGEVVFFAWHYNARRGYMLPTLNEAAAFIGLRKPTGCADYNGKVRLGKCVEKFINGEIWKHVSSYDSRNSLDFTDYYVWWNNGVCDSATSFAHAREIAEISTMSVNMSPPTQPKSAYPQNQKGYRASGATSSSKAKAKAKA